MVAEDSLTYNNEELYRTIIESSQDLIWILDEKGRFTFFNGRCEERNGTALSDIIGKDYFSLIHQEDVERVQGIFQKTMNGDSKPTK
jgi:PAS domain S-box-containing protein